jgi:cation diffusion facilitator family transporter
MQEPSEGQAKLRALRISGIAIFSVVLVEVTIGLLVNSLAIVSDGLHALLDALTSVMLFFAVRASLKPADEDHRYGHEKFEAIGGLVGGIILIAVACIIFYEAALRLISNAQLVGGIEYAGFIAIAYAMCIAALRVTVFRKNHNSESQSMKAGLYDAISDLGSTIIALLGFALALLGFGGADAFASIFLGCMLTYLSIKLAKASVLELSDTASKDIVEKTQKAIMSCQGVLTTQNLKVRKVSSKIFVEASVQVPNGMSLEDAHALSSRVELCLKEAFGNVDATIHIEPKDKDNQLKDQIQRLATIEGVKQIHEISTNYVKGKLFITLHGYVDPLLSVEEAHRLAEAIEGKLRGEIRLVENVTVHLEPEGVAIPAEQVDDLRVQKTVYEIARYVAGNLQVKRVVTYIASAKRYINIDCCFTKDVPIKEAHHLASLLEKETKDHFASAVVTVHIEPKAE